MTTYEWDAWGSRDGLSTDLKLEDLSVSEDPTE